MNNAEMNIGLQASVGISALSSLGYIHRSGIVGPYDNAMFNFLRNYQNVFHSGYTILQSHWQLESSNFFTLFVNTCNFPFLFLFLLL